MTAQNGTIRKVELPEVERSGCSLTVANWRRLLCYMSATPDLDPERLAIMILCRGKILASEEFRKNEWFKEIDTDYLLPGICHILVVDRVAKIPLAERLFFIRDKQPARVSVAASRKAYRRPQRDRSGHHDHKLSWYPGRRAFCRVRHRPRI
ncbi:MAG: hypothetical protein ACLR8Y_18590 [Alistipes indistinctus]